MRPELAKRDDVWRCRRRHVLAAGKNRHALVGRSSMRRRNPEEMTIKESSPGSVSCARIMLRDRSQGQEVIRVTGRWLLLTLLSVTNTVCPRLDIGMQVCAHRTQAWCDKVSHDHCLLVRPSGGRARCPRENVVTRCKGRLPNPPFVVAASALTDGILGALSRQWLGLE